MTSRPTDNELLEQIRASLDAHERAVDQGLVDRASGPVLARRHRFDVLRIGAIAVAVLLLVGLVAVVQVRGRPTVRPAGHPATASASNAPASLGGHAAQTDADMANLLLTITPTPGAVRRSALVGAPAAPGLVLPSSGQAVGRATAYWSASGSTKDAVAALAAHPVAGFRHLKVWATAPAPAPGTEIVLWASDEVRPQWMWPVVEFTIRAVGTGTAIRADATANVRDVRAPDTVLPADARLVGVHTLRVNAAGQPVVNDPVVTPSLAAAVLKAFATLGPSLGQFSPGPLGFECDPTQPVIPNQTTYTYSTGHGQWSVRSTDGCLGNVTVSNGLTVADQQLWPDAAWQHLEAGLSPTR